MQYLPLVGFYLRRHSQIENLVSSGASNDKTSHALIDVLETNLPLIKRFYPQLNKDGLLDDALATLKEALTAPAPSGPLGTTASGGIGGQ